MTRFFHTAVGLILGLSTLSVVHGQCHNESLLVCLQNKTGPGHRSAVQNTFTVSQQIDLVFLIDRSDSISVDVFNSVKTFLLKSLLPFLQSLGSFYIGRDYARVAAITFGFSNVVQFSSLSCSDIGVTGCDIEEKINTMTKQNDGQASTDLTDALIDVYRVFAGTDNRAGATQILWVFTDGQLDKDYLNVKLNQSYVEPLRQIGVHIFSVGIGRCPFGYLDEVLYEDNLKSLATKDANDSFYACIENWTQFLSIHLPVSNNPESTPSVGVVPIGVNNITECSGCISQNKSCVCNIVIRTATCSSIKAAADSCTGPTTGSPTVIPPRTITNSLLFIILVPLICGLMALIILILALVFGIRRCKNRKPRVPKPPPPPRLRRKQKLADDPVYNNKSTGALSYDIIQSRSSAITDIADIGEVGYSRDTISAERTRNNGDDTVSQWTDVTSVWDMTDDNDTIYINGEEDQIQSWEQYLTKEVKDHDLNSLSIHAIPSIISSAGTSWSASSPNFETTRSELLSINRLMRTSGSASYDNVMTVRFGTQDFKVLANDVELSETHLHGIREMQWETLSLRVIKMGGYLIIGIALSAMDSELESSVYKIGRSL